MGALSAESVMNDPATPMPSKRAAALLSLSCRSVLLQPAPCISAIRALDEMGLPSRDLSEALDASLADIRHCLSVQTFLTAVWWGTLDMQVAWRLDFLNMAVSLAHEPAVFHSLLGDQLLAAGDAEAAIAQYRMTIATSSEPVHLLHYRNLGLAQLAAGHDQPQSASASDSGCGGG